MKRVTVFAMTSKGHAVVSRLILGYPGLVELVVSARDEGIAEDGFDALRDLCRNKGVRFADRADSWTVDTEYAIAVSWRWLLDVSPAQLIVFHDSLLPRYRGFNPLVTALMAGDEKIGATAVYGADEYDRGDIIAQSATSVTYPLTIAEAISLVVRDYIVLTDTVAGHLSRDADPPAVPQFEDEVSYSLWRDEEDYDIDWLTSAEQIRRFVDAVGDPYRGAACLLGDREVRVLRVQELPDVRIANRAPGKVIFFDKGRPVVVCGSGLVRVDEAVDADTGETVLPLNRFRSRFRSRTSAS